MPRSSPLGPGLITTVSAFVLSVLGGCTAESTSEDGAVPEGGGDGTTSDDEIVSERQLMGSELPEKTIALTFDDGPGPRTAELADYLATKGISAAFFINGKNVSGRQDAIEKIIGRGQVLANHTQNHLQLTRLTADKIVKEVDDTDATLVAAQPSGPFLLRAPFGAWNGTVARAINATTQKKYVGSIFWDVGGQLTATAAADWDCWGKSVAVDKCGDLYLNEIRTKKRGIVLMHDIHGRTIDMVKLIVPKLQAEGWKFAKIGDVPSIKRALGTPTANADECASATLGRNVAENVCVQSRRDQKWYRCVDAEWIASAVAGDARCTQRLPISSKAPHAE